MCCLLSLARGPSLVSERGDLLFISLVNKLVGKWNWHAVSEPLFFKFSSYLGNPEMWDGCKGADYYLTHKKSSRKNSSHWRPIIPEFHARIFQGNETCQTETSLRTCSPEERAKSSSVAETLLLESCLSPSEASLCFPSLIHSKTKHIWRMCSNQEIMFICGVNF